MKSETLNLTLNELKAMTRFIKKNSYLSNLNLVLNDLKLIRKLFQRSTTSLLMISSKSIDFEGELMFEGEVFILEIFLKLTSCYCARVSESQRLHCRL